MREIMVVLYRYMCMKKKCERASDDTHDFLRCDTTRGLDLDTTCSERHVCIHMKIASDDNTN